MGKGCERVFAISSTRFCAFYPPSMEERVPFRSLRVGFVTPSKVIE